MSRTFLTNHLVLLREHCLCDSPIRGHPHWTAFMGIQSDKCCDWASAKKHDEYDDFEDTTWSDDGESARSPPPPPLPPLPPPPPLPLPLHRPSQPLTRSAAPTNPRTPPSRLQAEELQGDHDGGGRGGGAGSVPCDAQAAHRPMRRRHPRPICGSGRLARFPSLPSPSLPFLSFPFLPFLPLPSFAFADTRITDPSFLPSPLKPAVWWPKRTTPLLPNPKTQREREGRV